MIKHLETQTKECNMWHEPFGKEARRRNNVSICTKEHLDAH